MKNIRCGSNFVMALSISTALVAAPVMAQTAAPALSAGDLHRATAKTAAGMEWKGTLGALCIPSPPRGAAAAGPRAIPARATWYAPPHKVFDNLYWVGTQAHSSWALQTSQGIILIDTLFNYAAEAEIVDGLKTLGLDPATIKYVIVSHGHGDHDEGAKLLQDRYGARIVMGGPDWDMIEKAPPMPGGTPKRDIAAADGQKITLGDTSVTLVFTPGHSEGTFSMLFPVKDNGRTLSVAYNGGTLFGSFGNNAARFDSYIASQKKIAAAAAAAGASVLLTNHSEYDNAYTKARLTGLRKSGEPSPFEVGVDAIARYFTVSSECAAAEKLRVQGNSP